MAVNQVEFLGLAHAYATVKLSNVENLLHQTHSKKGTDTRVQKNLRKYYAIITNLAISSILTTFW